MNCHLKKLLIDLSSDKPLSFERLFHEIYQDLYVYGKQFELDEALLKDLIQEFFIKILQNPHSFLAEGNQMFYFLRSFRYHIIKDIKANQSHILKLKGLQVNTTEHSPELNMISDESHELQKTVVQSILDGVPKRQREILYLKYYANLSSVEIANLLGIKEQVVRNLTYRAIKAIRNTLKESKINLGDVLWKLGCFMILYLNILITFQM